MRTTWWKDRSPAVLADVPPSAFTSEESSWVEKRVSLGQECRNDQGAC